MARLQLDGPAAQKRVPVTDSLVVEVKAEATPLEERKAVTLNPLDGRIYLYFAKEGIVPTLSEVSDDGLVLIKGSKETYEASKSQKLYMLADGGTVDVIVVERA